MIEYIPPSELRPHPANEEIYGSESDESFDEFLDDVRRYGIRQNLVALPDRTLISGHRRLRAALKLDLPTVPVSFEQYENEDEAVIALIEANNQRSKTFSMRMKEVERLSPALEARGRQRMREGGRKGGRSTNGQGSVQSNRPFSALTTRDSLARRVGRSSTQLHREMKVWNGYRDGLLDADTIRGLDAREISVHRALKMLHAAEAREKRQSGDADDLHEAISPFDVWLYEQRDESLDDPACPLEGGSPPGQIFVNLIHYFSAADDLVLDPMAGSGITHRVCQLLKRRSACFDLAPTMPYIQRHDVLDGMPTLNERPSLIILDPPYAHQRTYSDDPNDLGRCSTVAEWLEKLDAILASAFALAQPSGRVALLVGNANPSGTKADLALSALRLVEKHGDLEQRIAAPYARTHFPGHRVSRARRERYMLALSREIFVARPRA